MKTIGLYESAAVKIQIMKTAIESACLLLRVDDIVSAKYIQPLSATLGSENDWGVKKDSDVCFVFDYFTGDLGKKVEAGPRRWRRVVRVVMVPNNEAKKKC